MGKNHFTEQQQLELSGNPYIQKVSETTITYTKEFKVRFEEEYRTGKSPSQILTDMGIDPHVIGRKRRDSLVHRIKVYESRPEKFNDTRKNKSGRPSTKDLTDAEKIKRLEQKIEYLKQENEFLKKNIQMDREANWEYKRKHPSNTNSSKE
jgi:transposase-like protein